MPLTSESANPALRRANQAQREGAGDQEEGPRRFLVTVKTSDPLSASDVHAAVETRIVEMGLEIDTLEVEEYEEIDMEGPMIA